LYIYMPSALVEQVKGIQVFYACPLKCSITTGYEPGALPLNQPH
jgi:hypothetical protein